jgi:hypothetical protein
MASLASLGRRAMSAGRSVGSGAARFSGHQGGRSFSSMGKLRMGAAAGAGIGMARHDNAKRGGYRPKSSATKGLQPRSSGGIHRFDYQGELM